MMKPFQNIGMHGRENCDVDIVRKAKMIHIMSIIAMFILVPLGLVDLITRHYAVGIFVAEDQLKGGGLNWRGGWDEVSDKF